MSSIHELYNYINIGKDNSDMHFKFDASERYIVVDTNESSAVVYTNADTAKNALLLGQSRLYKVTRNNLLYEINHLGHKKRDVEYHQLYGFLYKYIITRKLT